MEERELKIEYVDRNIYGGKGGVTEWLMRKT